MHSNICVYMFKKSRSAPFYSNHIFFIKLDLDLFRSWIIYYRCVSSWDCMLFKPSGWCIVPFISESSESCNWRSYVALVVEVTIGFLPFGVVVALWLSNDWVLCWVFRLVGSSLVLHGVFWARSVSISGAEALFMRNDCRPHAVSSPVLTPLLG